MSRTCASGSSAAGDRGARARAFHRTSNLELVCFRSVPAHLTEYILYAHYVLLGPIAWVLFFVGMLRGRSRLSLLHRAGQSVAGNPRVTILIPAKDEGERIRACIESALAQRYDNFTVVAI